LAFSIAGITVSAAYGDGYVFEYVQDFEADETSFGVEVQDADPCVGDVCPFWQNDLADGGGALRLEADVRGFCLVVGGDGDIEGHSFSFRLKDGRPRPPFLCSGVVFDVVVEDRKDATAEGVKDGGVGVDDVVKGPMGDVGPVSCGALSPTEVGVVKDGAVRVMVHGGFLSAGAELRPWIARGLKPLVVLVLSDYPVGKGFFAMRPGGNAPFAGGPAVGFGNGFVDYIREIGDLAMSLGCFPGVVFGKCGV